jgi:hypothetical protein
MPVILRPDDPRCVAAVGLDWGFYNPREPAFQNAAPIERLTRFWDREVALVHVVLLWPVRMFCTRLAEHQGQRAVSVLATANAAFKLPRLTALHSYLWPDWPTILRTLFLLWTGGIHTVLRQQKLNAGSTVVLACAYNDVVSHSLQRALSANKWRLFLRLLFQ